VPRRIVGPTRDLKGAPLKPAPNPGPAWSPPLLRTAFPARQCSNLQPRWPSVDCQTVSLAQRPALATIAADRAVEKSGSVA
jgi:hypothetical protein